uniref:very long chain fatty acid elongase 2-like isoform X2 n=1 Tax=Myxine glutinosa TaxID=7769 RepID=UPI00358E1BD9
MMLQALSTHSDDATINLYFDRWLGPRDARVQGWFLMNSYLPTLSLTIVYLLTVYLGPRVMRTRGAYNLRGAMMAYNLSVTCLSLYMLFKLCVSAREGNYNLKCQNMHSGGDGDLKVAQVLWWYYFSKAIELLDTIFFILRKKNNQVTFLHVYHHASMLNIWWLVMNWIPTGHTFFGAAMNCFIHVLMYLYYGLSTIPRAQPYLWWKKYITQAQLIQFVLTILHTISAIVWPCGFSIPWLMFLMFYMISLTALFLNFYVKTYTTKTKSKRSGEDLNTSSIRNGGNYEDKKLVRRKV